MSVAPEGFGRQASVRVSPMTSSLARLQKVTSDIYNINQKYNIHVDIRTDMIFCTYKNVRMVFPSHGNRDWRFWARSEGRSASEVINLPESRLEICIFCSRTFSLHNKSDQFVVFASSRPQYWWISKTHISCHCVSAIDMLPMKYF